MEYINFLGQRIAEGDYITYPSRTGSSLWMNVAKILEIKESYDWRDQPYTFFKVLKIYPNRSKKASTLVALERVVKLGSDFDERLL